MLVVCLLKVAVTASKCRRSVVSDVTPQARSEHGWKGTEVLTGKLNTVVEDSAKGNSRRLDRGKVCEEKSRGQSDCA